MNDEIPFLDEIKANPGDLTLRLVYADWLEERGDARGEYLRVDCELQTLISEVAADDSAGAAKARRLRAHLTRLGKTLDAAWIAIFDGLRPKFVQCRACKRVMPAKEAIDTNPRSYRKMKASRYCKQCYEDAVRAQLHRGSDAGGRYQSAQRDYHGGGMTDDD
jgi:uncharacterized protein (TIGR02996 family)